MRRANVFSSTNPASRGGTYVAVVLLLLAAVAPVRGADYQAGELRISWGTTLSYGAMWRVADRDRSIIGLTNGGSAFSVNGDDGNLNYDKGLVSNALKATTELELSYKNFGGFVRAFGFYDYENEKGDRARTPLTKAALDRVGKRAELRDAFAWYRFHVGNISAELRAGEQVLNWGESTFIQNGINTINPVDVSALRVPGSELREALLPIGAVSLSLGLSQNLAAEMYYQYRWEETIIDPAGTYFSTADLAGPGASRVMLGFGSVPDRIPIGPSPANPVGAVVPRTDDRKPRDGGQYGVALRWFVPKLNGTEFGLYHIKYHSRLPIINAITGTFAGLLPPNLNYAASARYFLSYPEDIKLYGASLNTQLGGTGIALQGEISHRKDVPLQVDDLELLYAALSPLRLVDIPAFAQIKAVGTLLAATNQIGAFGFGQEIAGYRHFDTTQVQFTATKIFGRLLGADQLTTVLEAAYSYVHDMPAKSVLRFEAPGTYTSGNPIHQQRGIQPGTEPIGVFAEEESWGYVFAARLDYNNVFANVNLMPRLSFAHDVAGISPGPGGNFLEGRNALTVGLAANLRINWEFDLSFTRYAGAGRYNLIRDRDFIATAVKYSF